MERYLDLGGHGPLIHLASANGFPPETYRPLCEYLAPSFHVVGYRSRPLWPDSHPNDVQSWHDLAHDLLTDLDTVSPNAPVIGMGHSLGGIMTLYAALIRPERFRALILIDPVLLPRRMLPLTWLARQTGQHHRSPLARGAANRRHRFASAQEALDRYQGRAIFANFTPEALMAYVEAGLRHDASGTLTLAWPREWESHIFALVPIDTWDAIARLRCPLLLIRGVDSELIINRSWAQLHHHLPHAQLVEVPGGHMVPMEQPRAVAEAIKNFRF